jgi:hypothetical protein
MNKIRKAKEASRRVKAESKRQRKRPQTKVKAAT